MIATVGRADALAACLESLALQSHRPAEIIVVHSGGDSGTRAVCERDWPSRGLTVHYQAYPQKSAALQRDFAARRTSQPLILFSDDDVEFEADFIERLFDVLTRDAAIGAAMGRVVNHTVGEPTPLWRAYRRLVVGGGRATLARRGGRRDDSQRISLRRQRPDSRRVARGRYHVASQDGLSFGQWFRAVLPRELSGRRHRSRLSNQPQVADLLCAPGALCPSPIFSGTRRRWPVSIPDGAITLCVLSRRCRNECSAVLGASGNVGDLSDGERAGAVAAGPPAGWFLVRGRRTRAGRVVVRRVGSGGGAIPGVACQACRVTP